MKKLIIAILLLLCGPAPAEEVYVRRYPTNTPVKVYDKLSVDSDFLKINQTTPQTVLYGAPNFSGGINMTLTAADSPTFTISCDDGVMWSSTEKLSSGVLQFVVPKYPSFTTGSYATPALGGFLINEYTTVGTDSNGLTIYRDDGTNLDYMKLYISSLGVFNWTGLSDMVMGAQAYNPDATTGRSTTVQGGKGGSTGPAAGKGGQLNLYGGNAGGTVGDADGGDVLIQAGSPVNAGTGGNIIAKLRDAAGANKLSIQDTNGTEVMSLDSIGKLWFQPTVEWYITDIPVLEVGTDSPTAYYDGTPLGIYWSNMDSGSSRFDVRTQGGNYIDWCAGNLIAQGYLYAPYAYLTALTSGRVVYVGGGSILTDLSTFVFDGTNLGIGQAVPAHELHIYSTSTPSMAIDCDTLTRQPSYLLKVGNVVRSSMFLNSGGTLGKLDFGRYNAAGTYQESMLSFSLDDSTATFSDNAIVTGNFTAGSGATTSTTHAMTGPLTVSQVSTTAIGYAYRQSVTSITRVVVQNNYAFATAGSSLYIYDVSNPASITLKGTYTDTTNLVNVRMFVVSGNYAYLCDNMNHKIVIVDVSNVNNPTLAGIVADHSFYPQACAVSGSTLFVTSYGGYLTAYDVSDVANPKYLTRATNSVGGWVDVQVIGGKTFCYVTTLYGDNHLYIYEFTAPNTLTSRYALECGRVGAVPTAYADSANHPGVNTTITSANNLLSDGNSVTITGTTGAEYDGTYTVEHCTQNTFDIVKAYGTNPAAKGTWSGGAFSNAVSCKAVGRYLYVADTYNTKFKIVDVQDPTAPKVVGGWMVTQGYLNGPQMIDISGNYAAVTNWATNGITVFNVSDPTAPTFVDTFATGNYAAESVQFYGKYLFGSSSGSNYFYMWNFATITSPMASIGTVTSDTVIANDKVLAKNINSTGSMSVGGNALVGGTITAQGTGDNSIAGNLAIGKGTPNETLTVFDGNLEVADDATLGSESLNENDFSASTKWTLGSGWTIAGGKAVYKTSAVATITQTNANMAVATVPNRWYKFTYTISGENGAVVAATVTTAGSGYAVGDHVQLDSGDGNCVGHVISINGSGGITSFQTTYGGSVPGSGYIRGTTGVTTTALTGIGSGAVFTITQISSLDYLSVTTAFCEAVTYLDASVGTHTTYLKTGASPTGFVIEADSYSSYSFGFSFDDFSLKELQAGDAEVHGWITALGGKIRTNPNSAMDLDVTCGANKTIELQNVVYDDVRINLGNISRPGGSDPAWVAYDVNGGGVSTYLLEFEKNEYGTFTVQIPHGYKEGENIKVHLHWTPGPRGNEENAATVGWKVDYSWANINGNFGTMSTADLSDACDGTDHKHQMTPEVSITGTSKNVSSMLICNVKRTDISADDTWVGTASGELPMLLEVDFHFPIDTIGSRDWTSK
ncbi:MAG: hypothetical protein SFH39_00535 [Candidatus Magnetobacterium sp. LHC-1]